jgi:hypothetical protein
VRCRVIKPEFWSDDTMAELPPLVRLFYIGLWGNVDREGRGYDRPRQLLAAILPYDRDADGEQFMHALEAKGRLVRYAVAGVRYFWIPSFTRHQSINNRETQSTIPPCSDDPTEATRGSSVDPLASPSDFNACLTRDARVPNASAHGLTQSKLREGREGPEGREEHDLPTTPSRGRRGMDGPEYSPAFEAAWTDRPRRIGGDSKAEAWAAWRARVREGVSEADLAAGLRRYKAHLQATGKLGTPYVKQGATFFGPGRHWEEDWAIAVVPASGTGAAPTSQASPAYHRPAESDAVVQLRDDVARVWVQAGRFGAFHEARATADALDADQLRQAAQEVNLVR